ncbi:RHS repeat-associated core domain-containing protein [Pseudomonas ovata]|uniref:RHS repeat-associated core domain-containing protein n=1 Tax=Pseudomonas ovata TaxID=1839709 RepID=UPI000D68E606|nr:RHS repeat-associated core domain-containing protein [Pseudomonas ovata]
MTHLTPEWLCRYHYDPIDRLAGCSPVGQRDVHCFYRLNRLSTEIQRAVQTSCLRALDLLLAQQRLAAGQGESLLLATDPPGSVMHALNAGQQHRFAYLPYGMRHPDSASLPGFNGERLDPVTGHYLLGNGYRAFNPVLMRFNSPDSLSPFGEGGLNAYAYCVGDPVNRVDPTGHLPSFFKRIRAWINPVKATQPATNIRKIADGIFSFEKSASKTKVIGFLGHGTAEPPAGFEPMHLAMSGGNALTPRALYNRAMQAGVEVHSADKVKLLLCFSGAGAENSFASEFSKVSGRLTKGYDGLVHTNLSPVDIENLIATQSDSIRKLSSGAYEYQEGITAYKKEPFRSLFSRRKNIYRPVTFSPL